MGAAAPFSTTQPADLGRRYGPWLALLILAVAAGAFARHGLIESTPIGLMCQGAEPAWYCGMRQLLIMANQWNGWSWAAMIGGALAMLFGWRWTIILGLVAGAIGLSLYNAGPAAFGLLLSLMRLVRR